MLEIFLIDAIFSSWVIQREKKAAIASLGIA